ncbi:MAG: glycerate kinase [Alistipes sp.]|nr:glycerate kinase [Alistipes sp.]
MKRITIATDSFKGSLSSSQVADAIERGLCCVLP